MQIKDIWRTSGLGEFTIKVKAGGDLNADFEIRRKGFESIQELIGRRQGLVIWLAGKSTGEYVPRDDKEAQTTLKSDASLWGGAG